MKISEIKDPELRALAELRRAERDKSGYYAAFEDYLEDAFDWDKTPEKGAYWKDVFYGRTPTTPNTDPCPSDYVMD